jgi:spore germination cell wall hydrolase CwlJ-like protein
MKAPERVYLENNWRSDMKYVIIGLMMTFATCVALAEVSEERIQHELAIGERLDKALILANVATCEASVEGRIGKLAVMDVVRVRVEKRQFPNTVESVVYQRHQFECVTKGIQHTMSDYRFSETLKLAFDHLDGKTPRITNADHYYNPDKMPNGIPPRWATPETYLGRIGSHVFHKLY